MSNSAQNTIDKTPGVGDIPILGTLFRSTSFRRGETELVIIVTPYLVNPVNANDIKLPTDGYQTPNEIQRLLGNMGSDGKSGVDRPMPRAEQPRPADPEVGLGTPAVPQNQPRSENRSASRSNGKSSNAPAPGFSLK
jgi:pilus assembly protein CpaC